MSTPVRALLLTGILIVAASAAAQINIVNFDFGAVPIACGWYAYEAPGTCARGAAQDFNGSPGFGWLLGGAVAWEAPHGYLMGGGGLTAPNSAFNPPPFDGLPFTQAVLLQNAGSFVWQRINGFNPGAYTLSFYLGSRYASGGFDGAQTVAALIDGHVIGTWALASSTPFTLQRVQFTVSTPGTHTLTFVGLVPGDHTAFLSYVVITPTPR